jgi:hypothetical protein
LVLPAGRMERQVSGVQIWCDSSFCDILGGCFQAVRGGSDGL